MNRLRLSKSLIIITLILSIIMFIPGINLINPTVAYASDVEVTTESEEQEEDEKYVIGVHREPNIETNTAIFNEQVTGIAKIAFAFLVFVMVLYIGIDAIVKSYDGKSRAEIIEKFKHIIYGVLLFAIAGLIVGIASDFQETMLDRLYSEPQGVVEVPELEDDGLSTNWLANILEMGLKIVGRLLEYLIQLLFSIITLDGGNIAEAANPFDGGDYSLNEILFLADFGNTIDLNAINSRGMKLTTAPFTVEEFSRYTNAYLLLTSISVPLMLLSLLKVAYEMVVNAGNFEKVMEVKKTVLRICTGVLIVAVGPYLFRCILTFFNMLVYLVPVDFTFDIIIEDINDSSGILSVLTSIWWLWIKFKIMLAFVAREIMLTVMYIATPVVIGFWTFSVKTQMFNRWIGEIITNAATQFCYAMVFFMATMVLSGAQTNAFFTLIWLSMMLKLANFFKDSFQGLFSKWGGVDEAGVADSMASKIGGYSSNVTLTSVQAFDPKKQTRLGRFMYNAVQAKDSLKSGKLPEFTTRAATQVETADKKKSDAREEWRVANEYMKTAEYTENTAPGTDGARVVEACKIIAEDASRPGSVNKDRLDDANETAKNAANSPNAIIRRIYNANTDYYKALRDIEEAKIMKDYAKKQREKNFTYSVQKGIKDYHEKDLASLAKAAKEKENNSYANAAQQNLARSGQTNNVRTLEMTKRLGNIPVSVNENELRKRMVDQGYVPNAGAITAESMQKAGEGMITNVESSIRDAKKAIANQTSGSNKALTEAAKQSLMDNTNKQVEKCVNSIAQLYSDKIFVKNDRVATKLDDLVKEVESNGDAKLASELREKIASIGNVKEESIKL